MIKYFKQIKSVKILMLKYHLIIVIILGSIISNAQIKIIKFSYSDCDNKCKKGINNIIENGDTTDIFIGTKENCCNLFSPFYIQKNDTLYIGYKIYGGSCRCGWCGRELHYKFKLPRGLIIVYLYKNFGFFDKSGDRWHPDWDTPEKRDEIGNLCYDWIILNSLPVNSTQESLERRKKLENTPIELFMKSMGTPEYRIIKKKIKKLKRKIYLKSIFNKAYKFKTRDGIIDYNYYNGNIEE